MKNYG